MADDFARRDVNKTTGLLVHDINTGELRRLYVNASGQLIVTTSSSSTATLTERMFAKAPQPAYRIWLDTVGTAIHAVTGSRYLFIAEAPLADTGATGNHGGIRIPLDALGNTLGEVEENTAFVWNDRFTSNVGWS